MAARPLRTRTRTAPGRARTIMTVYCYLDDVKDDDGGALYFARARPGDVLVIGTDGNASIGRGRLDGGRDDGVQDGDRASAVGPFGMPHMNASGRRLRTFLENYEHAPPDDVLEPLLEHAATEREMTMRQVQAEDVIAPGLREDSPHKRRFNLEHEDWQILARTQGGR